MLITFMKCQYYLSYILFFPSIMSYVRYQLPHSLKPICRNNAECHCARATSRGITASPFFSFSTQKIRRPKTLNSRPLQNLFPPFHENRAMVAVRTLSSFSHNHPHRRVAHWQVTSRLPRQGGHLRRTPAHSRRISIFMHGSNVRAVSCSKLWREAAIHGNGVGDRLTPISTLFDSFADMEETHHSCLVLARCLRW